MHFDLADLRLLIAVRHSRTMQLVSVALDEPWAIRERSILVRELQALPGVVRALIATLMPATRA